MGGAGMRNGRAYAAYFSVVLVISLSIASVLVVQDMQAREGYEKEMALFSSTPGGHAWDYLQNSTYTTLLFEVDVLSPYLTDDPYAKQFNTTYLAKHFDAAEELIRTECMNKTIRYVWTLGSFEYTYDFYDMYSSYYPEFTASELIELAASYRNYSTDGDTCVIHLIFLDGRYVTSNSNGQAIGGVSYAGTTVDASTMFIFLPATVENSLYGPEYPYLSRDIAHELGHLLGLVAPFGDGSSYDPPSSTEHRDPESVRHCSNTSCLMNAGINKGVELCDDCKADLADLRSSDVPYNLMTAPRIDWLPFGVCAAVAVVSTCIIYASRRP